MSGLIAGRSRLRASLGFAVLASCSVVAQAQSPPAKLKAENSRIPRPLALSQTRYHLRAGESVKIAAPRETLDFLIHAKTHRVEMADKEARGIVVRPNVTGDHVFLAASLAMKPGEYRVNLLATSEAGEQRATTLAVTLEPMQAVSL